MQWQALLVSAVLLSLGSSLAPAADLQPRRFIVEVTAVKPGQEQTFRAAVGYAGRVEFIEAKTPFKKELTANSLTFMFEVLDGKSHVLAQLHGERDGKMTLFGNVGGKSGKITDAPWSCETLSFGPF